MEDIKFVNALNDAELDELARLADEHKLENIHKLIVELRVLRNEHVRMAGIIAKQGVLIQTLQPDMQKRYASEMEAIAHATPKS